VALDRDLAPGDSARVRLSFEVPRQDGRYRVLVSPMREGVLWYYQAGWPALELEASTKDGVSRLQPARVTTAAELRRKNAVRALGRGLVYPWLAIWRNRRLLGRMVWRDFPGRHRLWTVGHPLLLILTYFLVFGFEGKDHTGYALYLLGGILPWLAFSEAVGRAPAVLQEHRGFIRKHVLAVEALPVNLVLAGLATECVALVLYCGFLLAAGRGIPATVLWLPVLLIPQLLFTAGLAWFLAGLGVYVRDLGHIAGSLLTVWFFLTPICYYDDRWLRLAPWIAKLLFKNPMYLLAGGYRSIFLWRQTPAFGHLWKFWVLSLVVFELGHAWFYKLRRMPAAETAPRPAAVPAAHAEADQGSGLARYLSGWAASPEAKNYLGAHATRLLKTLEITPPGGPADRVLEMGAYLQITPALHFRLGYGEVRGCYYGKLGRTDHREAASVDGETFACDVDHFDAEKDVFPYPDGYFSTVVCGELIEHLFEDPMHLMSEVNRILKPGGHLVLTTPNIASLRGIQAILHGGNPGFFQAYIKPGESGEVAARHNREYSPDEILKLLDGSGFEVERLETGEFRDAPHPELAWVRHMLRWYWLEMDRRGDGIYALGRKVGPVTDRYPEWLYS
jgi:homopolymeric O-antigen transport system permease protein